MRTRRASVLIVVLMALAWSLGIFTAPAAAQKFGNFVNQKFKFATQLPNHWESNVKDNSLIFSGPKNTEERFVTINFQFINRQPRDTLEGQGKDLESQWAALQGYKLLEKGKGSISGQPALRLVAVYQPPQAGGEPYQQEQYVIERGAYFYYVGFTSPQRLFHKYKWAMDHAIKTFKFLPEGG